jgi:hypothetical protein
MNITHRTSGRRARPADREGRRAWMRRATSDICAKFVEIIGK